MTAPALPRLLPRRDELAELLRLALPVVTVQVGLMLLGVVDSLMVGRVSPAALAAVALGNLHFNVVALFGMGVLLALDPLVSQAVGARDDGAVTHAFQRGLVLAALLAVPASLLLLPTEPLLRLFRQPAELVPLARDYVWLCIPSVLPFLGFTVLRQTLQAMHLLRPVVLVIVAANVANAGLNRVLIFGLGPVPPLGVAGSAVATTACRWLMAAGLLAAAWPVLRPHLRPFRRDALAWAPLARVLRIGLPIGAQIELELGVFAAIALLMGAFGTPAVAAHQVAINLASLTFMVPMGIGAAATVLVGNAVGRGDGAGVRRAARAALVAGVAFMAATALAFLSAPRALTGLYTSDAAVLSVAATLLPIAGVFQVFDGIQVVSVGILRGVADTRTPFLINVVGFWLVGFPVSLWLGYRTPLGPAGLWWGLMAGLAMVAGLLVARIARRVRGGVVRVEGGRRAS